MTHPAGWYPDPGQAGWWRWWDGAAWSGHTAPMGAPGTPGASTEPLPGPPQPETGGILVRGLRKLAEAGQSAEGSTIADRYRGTQPILAQGERHQYSRNVLWAGVIVGSVLTVVATVIVIGLAVDRTGENTTTAPQLRTWAVVGAGLCAAVAVWSWRRYWLVTDTPTVEVAGAHPGMCEMVGTARPLGEPVASWFTGAPTVWSSAKVERRSGSGKNAKWRTVWHRYDGSGRFLLVGDEGAAIEVDAAGTALKGGRIIAGQRLDGGHRFDETALVVGDRLYVLGPVHLCDDGHLRVAKAAGRRRLGLRGPLWITQRGEAGVRRRLRRAAVLTTLLSMALAAFVAVVEEIPSDDPEYETELIVRREGALLAPALTVAGLLAVGYLVGYLWRLWNRLVALRSQAANAWSLIDVAAARRHDTIGQLVAITEAAAAHERAAHTAVATTRAGLPSGEGVGVVDAELATDAPARAAVVARAEAVPELAASAAFTGLFQELVATENRVAAARRFYNDAVTELADRTSTFPGLLLKPLVAPTIPPLLTFDASDLRPAPMTP